MTAIAGYRVLEEAETALVNQIKAKAEEVGTLVESLQALVAPDKRWVSIGKTELQQGFMALVRSVTKPTTF